MKKLLLLLAVSLLLCGCAKEIDPRSEEYLFNRDDGWEARVRDIKYLNYKLDRMEKKIDKLLEREW